VRKDSVSKLARTANVESISPILWKRAGQLNVSLPPEVARHIAQNVRSRESELRSALMRVVADFSVTGTEITRTYAQRALRNLNDKARKSTVDRIQNPLFKECDVKEAKVRPEDCVATGGHFFSCLQNTRDGRKTSRVRLELEVNMRESERERLTRRDAYERDLERRARKRSRS
jgi:hypothetical protein